MTSGCGCPRDPHSIELPRHTPYLFAFPTAVSLVNADREDRGACHGCHSTSQGGPEDGGAGEAAEVGVTVEEFWVWLAEDNFPDDYIGFSRIVSLDTKKKGSWIEQVVEYVIMGWKKPNNKGKHDIECTIKFTDYWKTDEFGKMKANRSSPTVALGPRSVTSGEAPGSLDIKPIQNAFGDTQKHFIHLWSVLGRTNKECDLCRLDVLIRATFRDGCEPTKNSILGVTNVPDPKDIDAITYGPEVTGDECLCPRPVMDDQKKEAEKLATAISTLKAAYSWKCKGNRPTKEEVRVNLLYLPCDKRKPGLAEPIDPTLTDPEDPVPPPPIERPRTRQITPSAPSPDVVVPKGFGSPGDHPGQTPGYTPGEKARDGGPKTPGQLHGPESGVGRPLSPGWFTLSSSAVRYGESIVGEAAVRALPGEGTTATIHSPSQQKLPKGSQTPEHGPARWYRPYGAIGRSLLAGDLERH